MSIDYTSGDSNVFTRCGEIDKDQQVIGHAHNFDHITYVPRGGIRFEMLNPTSFREDGYPAGFEVIKTVDKWAVNGRCRVLIRAGVYHRLIGLEDHSLYDCIYAHRTPQGEIVQEYDGWAKAYE